MLTDVSFAAPKHIQDKKLGEMNKEWYTTPKCTVAETVGHRIILTSNFNICQRQ